jgi:LPXTG-site transpeptidase (sortase) family protein
MDTVLRWLIRGLVTVAALCFAIVAWTVAEQAYYRAAARALSLSVRTASDAVEVPSHSPATESPAIADPDSTVIAATAVPANRYAPGLIGELDVPHLGIATAVVEGDDGASLRRGAGHLRWTAMPGDTGNVVLAGHRDTVFRRLGDLQRGDRLRLTTARGVFHYRVARTLRVRPSDTWVLHRTAAALTLITCYPFDWVGSAPERWIVQAETIGVPTRSADATGSVP